MVKIYAIFTEQSGDDVAPNEASSNLQHCVQYDCYTYQEQEFTFYEKRGQIYSQKRREAKLTQTITVNDPQAMTSFLIQLAEINNKRVTISNFQLKRLSGHAHTQLI